MVWLPQLTGRGIEMGECFDSVYEDLCEAWEHFCEFGMTMFTGLLYITFPIWLIPYLVIKIFKGGIK